MRTIQMTLDDELVEAVDRVVKRLRTTRSAFTRAALRSALKKQEMLELERRHRDGYERHPVDKEAFEDWEGEQNWGDL